MKQINTILNHEREIQNTFKRQLNNEKEINKELQVIKFQTEDQKRTIECELNRLKINNEHLFKTNKE